MFVKNHMLHERYIPEKGHISHELQINKENKINGLEITEGQYVVTSGNNLTAIFSGGFITCNALALFNKNDGSRLFMHITCQDDISCLSKVNSFYFSRGGLCSERPGQA